MYIAISETLTEFCFEENDDNDKKTKVLIKTECIL